MPLNGSLRRRAESEKDRKSGDLLEIRSEKHSWAIGECGRQIFYYGRNASAGFCGRFFVVTFTAHLFAVYNEKCAELIRFLKEASLLNIADISEIMIWKREYPDF